MAILSRDEYFEKIQNMLDGASDEQSIAFLEDMTDTYNDLENKAQGDGEDWKERYEQLDQNWRARYKSRFFSAGGSQNIPHSSLSLMPEPDPIEERANTIKINDLFNTK